jgi:hypothetical protein
LFYRLTTVNINISGLSDNLYFTRSAGHYGPEVLASAEGFKQPAIKKHLAHFPYIQRMHGQKYVMNQNRFVSFLFAFNFKKNLLIDDFFSVKKCT